MFRSSKTDQHHYQANNKHAAYRNNGQMSTTITTTSPPRALRLNTSLRQKFVASSGDASRLTSSSPPPRSVVSSSSMSSSSSSPTTAKLSNSTEQTPIIGAGGPRQIQPRLISGSTRFAHNGTTAATTTTTSATKSFLGDSNNTCGPYQELSPPPSGRPYRRLKPLTVQEYETKFRTSASDLELVERIYAGSMSCNQLRAALWPYLLGIITHRGRFERICSPEGRQGWLFVEHEANKLRWRDLQRKYETYQGQWRSILPEQEPRFSTFRERKSLIETDVIRCDRLHPFYGEDSANLAKLTNLLMTYMMYDFDIGYLQGMSDIAAPILYVMQGDLVKSFWVFVEVMKLFRRNFEASQKTIHFQLNCLYRLIKLTDRKFAHYLGQNECSNCFFAFRCIVCQFKRELMKCNGDKQAENEHENDDHEDDLFENNHRDDENINQNGHPKAHNYDYSNVLKLWDTIWCVQRRHELLSRNKCTHTFTIANGAHSDNNYKLSANHQLHRHTNNNNNRNRSPTHSSSSPTSSTARLMRHQQDHSAPNGTPTTKTHTNNQQSESSPKSRTQQQNHNHTYSHNNQQQHHRNNASGHLNHHHHHNHHQNGTSNGQNGSAGLTNGHHNNAHQTTTTSGTKTTNGFSTSNSSPNFASHRQHSITSIRSNGSTSGGGGGGPASPTFGPSLIGSYQQQQINLINGCSDRLSPLSVSLASVSINNSPSMNGSADSNSHHNGCCKQTTQQPVKQEQIVYTKETFYSSFDPNQADVPRFELTETEKFMLSLCLSMIRRERNNILLNRMDATEIHQLFINPHLACDLDDFINQAYEIYTYLNTDCDLQRVVKRANEFSANGTTGGAGLGANNLAATATTNGSDLSPVTNIGIDIQSEPGSWPKDSADTADTYDLLKDYLIISPHSYNTSASSTLAHNNLIGSINYIGSNRHQNSHHIIDNNNHHHKPWDHFIDNSPPT